jgi:hypothetical protein
MALVSDQNFSRTDYFERLGAESFPSCHAGADQIDSLLCHECLLLAALNPSLMWNRY